MWQSCAEPWDRDLALPADGEVDGAQTILWSQKPRAEPGAGVRWQCCTEGHGSGAADGSRGGARRGAAVCWAPGDRPGLGGRGWGLLAAGSRGNPVLGHFLSEAKGARGSSGLPGAGGGSLTILACERSQRPAASSTEAVSCARVRMFVRRGRLSAWTGEGVSGQDGGALERLPPWAAEPPCVQ